jgi:hypothetical protein
VAHQPCPPRHGPNQHLAGMVDDDPMMAQTAVKGCAYSAPAANGAGGINLSAGRQGTNPYYAGFAVANDALTTEVVVDDVGVADQGALREPRARRARRPRTSSGHRESRSRSRSTRSRTGGHSSHHK